MKRIILTFLFAFCIVFVNGQITVLDETFDNASQFSVTKGAPFNDGGEDYFTLTDGSTISSLVEFNDFRGQFLAAQDLDGEGGPPEVQITWSNLDISNLTDLSFSGLFAEDDSTDGDEDWDFNSSVLIEYSIDGGAYIPLLAFEAEGGADTSPAEDTNFDGIGDGDILKPDATEFNKSIAAIGSVLSLRLTISNLDDEDEDIAIDELKIVGITAPLVELWSAVVSDEDGNGTFTTGEEYQTGWIIDVYDANTDELLATDTTVDTGTGSLPIHAELGSYAVGRQLKVCMRLVDGWTPTGPATSFDSVLGQWCNSLTVPDVGGPIISIFYARPPVELWSAVVSDEDGNGTFTPGEEYQTGWIIDVYDANTNSLLSTDTTVDTGTGSIPIRAELGGYAVGRQLKVCIRLVDGWTPTGPATSFDSVLGQWCNPLTVPDVAGPIISIIYLFNDLEPPTATIVPNNGATDVPIDTSIMLTFSEPVQAGSGTIDIFDNATATGTPVFSFSTNTGTGLIFNGSTLTIDIPTNLEFDTTYSIKITDGTIEDLAGNDFVAPGILSFTTVSSPVDIDPPTITDFNPTDGATGVPVDSDIFFRFSEDIQSGSGNILLWDVDGNTSLATISITDASQVSISSGILTIDPTSDLPVMKQISVALPRGVVQDLAGNDFVGLSLLTYDFTTGGTNYDYGDAPMSYPTLLADSGARHAESSLFLGSSIDFETDGQPDVSGQGDDNANVDDEDGVTFTSTLIPGQSATVDVVSTGTGLLSAWIDFNADGDWADAGEAAVMNQGVIAGTNTINIAVPAGALNGNTFARFRLSTAGTTLVTGDSADGEVEDYQVAINAPTDTTPPSLISLTPSDGATNVNVAGNLVVEFDEDIQAVSGNNVIIWNNDTSSAIATISLTDATQITVSGNSMIVDPTANLPVNSDISVGIPSGGIQDLSGNSFGGINLFDDWRFSTEAGDTTPPLISAFVPIDDSIDVPVDVNLMVMFNEDVRLGSAGTIVIRKTSDDSVVETFDVATTIQLSISGSTLTIDPSSDLNDGTEFYVTIDNGAIEDLVGNVYQGFSGTTVWSFTTVAGSDTTPPTITCPADINFGNDIGLCGAVVNYSVTANDDMPGFTVTQTGGLSSGAVFPVGTTTNSFTVTDAAGNTAGCSFDVTVNDTEAPVAVCQDITVELDATNNVSITAADVDGGSTDNCGIASLSVSPSSFTDADLGDNPVTLTVADTSGNVSTCTATVTVESPFCPDFLPNEDPGIVINSGGGIFLGLDAAFGTSDVTNGSTCALALQNNDVGQPFASFRIPLDLSTYGINAGDELFISLDALNNGGVARIEVLQNNQPNTALASNTYSGPGWETYSATITVPAGLSSLNIWLYSNYLSSSPGTAYYDNLIIQNLTAGGGNVDPIANAGLDQTVTDGDNDGSADVTLDGSGSFDPDGTIASYSWSDGTGEIATGESPTVTLPVGTTVMTLTVTDDDGAMDTDTVTITVNPGAGNLDPVANAGPDQTVSDGDNSGNEVVTLDGTASFDPDGSIVSYVWSLGGTNIATGAAPTVMLPVGTSTITLMVMDDDGATNTDTVDITVTDPTASCPDDLPNEDPSIVLPTGAGFLGLDTAVGTSTTTNGSPCALAITKNDVGQPFANYRIPIVLSTYGINAGDELFISLDALNNGGIARLEVNQNNSPNTALASNTYSGSGWETYSATITVPAGITSIDIWIYSNYLSSSPGTTYYDNLIVTNLTTGGGNIDPVADAGPDQTVVDTDENGSEDVTLDGSGSFDVDGTIVSYDWSNGSTGVNPTASFPVGTTTVTLTVTDDDGATDTDTVDITVTGPTNLDPIANAGPNQTVVDTDGNGSEDVTLDGSGSFDLDGTIVDYAWSNGSTGVSPTATFPVGTTTVTLTVTDDDGATATDTVVITVVDPGAPCPDELPNEDSIVLMGDGGFQGLDSFQGTSAVTNGSPCALEVTNNDVGQPFANYRIPIPLAANGINPGDQLFISLDGNSSQGVARIEVNQDNSPNTALAFNTYVGGWSTFSQTITVPSGITSLNIWLYSNYLDFGSGGTAYYDNLIVRKLGPTGLEPITSRASLNSMRLSPNPANVTSNLSFERPEEIKEILIFDMAGRMVQRFDADEIRRGEHYEMDVYSMPVGTYIIRSRSIEGIEYSGQMVIER